jgi:nucleotide-binding universal stress UspA family protein
MVYVDGTEQSITAVQYAICLASFSSAELIAHYVINTRAMEDLLRARIFLKDEQEDYEHDMEADAERYLNHVNELAVKKGLSIITRRSKGNVHKEIVNAIKEEDVDLLVIGELSRIRSRRDEFYDGHNANSLISQTQIHTDVGATLCGRPGQARRPAPTSF